MSNHKHTPGPWTSDELAIWQDANNNRTHMKKIGNAIHSTEDAKLMAAAPELLEACIRLMKLMGGTKQATTPEFLMLENAVAKAKGES